MSYKYVIKRTDDNFLCRYFIQVENNEKPLDYERDYTITLWGARRRVKKLLRKLNWKDKVIEKGKLK